MKPLRNIVGGRGDWNKVIETIGDYVAPRHGPTGMFIRFLYKNREVLVLAALYYGYKKWADAYRLRIERKVDEE